MTPVGTKVTAICDDKNGVVRSFGEGTYAGDFVPPDDVELLISGLKITNPRIDLDCGKSVWGCECWWGPSDAVKKRFPEPDWKWEIVDADAIRAEFGKED